MKQDIWQHDEEVFNLVDGKRNLILHRRREEGAAPKTNGVLELTHGLPDRYQCQHHLCRRGETTHRVPNDRRGVEDVMTKQFPL